MADFHFEPAQVQSGLSTFSSTMASSGQTIAGFIADFNNIPDEDLGGCDAGVLDTLTEAFNQAKSAADSFISLTNKFGNAIVTVSDAYASGGEKFAEEAANGLTNNMQTAATEAEGAANEYAG